MFEQMKVFKDLSVYKIVGMQLGSVEGYIASVVLAYSAVLLGIYCIVTSTSTLAGEEDNGTLEFIVAMPLTRSQILTAKAVALSVTVISIMIIVGIGNAFLLEFIKFDTYINITPLALFVALISSLPLVVGLIMIGLFLGAILPNRRTAVVVMSVYFIASYFGENIAVMSKSLEPIKYFSLFNYYNTTASIFSDGPQLSDTLILLGIAVVFFVLASMAFQRRNITVGTWPWQSLKIED
jgi:ABC-2 type transport system permease protein